MASQGFSWRLATSNADLTAAYNLRNEVFKEQGFDPNRELDTLDETAAQIILIDENDNSVQATLRVLPMPPADEPAKHIPPTRKDDAPPGSGRSEEQVIQSILDGQQPLEKSVDGPAGASVLLSGVKFGRVAIHNNLHGRGAGRRLIDDAEQWVSKVLCNAPVPPGTKEVDANVHISGQANAKKFYDRLGYATDNNEYLEEGQPHLLFWKRLTVRRA